MSVQTIFCGKEGCLASEGGVCLDGLPFEECPHAEVKDSINSEEEEEEEEEELSEDIEVNKEDQLHSASKSTDARYHIFYDGKEFGVEEAYSIAAAECTKVIVLAGQAESGKTTLLASLYESFQDGPVCGYSFAGSRTLTGFEQRCHLSRVESEQDHPDTERTKPEWELKLLHLAVKEPCSKEQDIINLLFTDISGEIFTRAIADIEEAQKLRLLSRADHFVLFIDGERINDLNTRNGTVNTSRLILKALLEAEVLNPNCYVDVIFSKYDLIKSQGVVNNSEEYAESVIASFRKNFQAKLRMLRFSFVASRSELEEVTSGHGLDNLFKSWVSDSVSINKIEENMLSNESLRSLPEYERFYYRS